MNKPVAFNWENPPITHWLPLPAGRGETAE